jgi:hypothetical protein
VFGRWFGGTALARLGHGLALLGMAGCQGTHRTAVVDADYESGCEPHRELFTSRSSIFGRCQGRLDGALAEGSKQIGRRIYSDERNSRRPRRPVTTVDRCRILDSLRDTSSAQRLGIRHAQFG